MKLTEWIEKVFLSLEKKDNEKQKHLPKEKRKPFEYRFRGIIYQKKEK